MTNYEALYNQAMAHNAMLREAVAATLRRCYNYNDHRYDENTPQAVTLGEEALNATGPDVEAWKLDFEKAIVTKHSKALIEANNEFMAKVALELATVTAERDALEKQKNAIQTPAGRREI